MMFRKKIIFIDICKFFAVGNLEKGVESMERIMHLIFYLLGRINNLVLDTGIAGRECLQNC